MTSGPARHVVIAGITTRPFAASAARAGYRVTAVDAFGDRDLEEIAQVIRPEAAPAQRFGPLQAAQAAAEIPAPFAAYTSNFENYPAAVTRLAQGRCLLGNPASTLTRIRNPVELMRLLQRFGIPALQSRVQSPARASDKTSWLLKPRRSGGGHGIRRWSPGQPVPRTMYLQERIAGVPGSISFIADGVHAVILGWSQQLVAERDFGARKYRYCGSLVAPRAAALFRCQTELLERAAEIVRVLTREFRLVGLNGLDFIARNGVPYPTEVNPRYSSSMELIERATGRSLFQLHVRACGGALPEEPAAGHTVHGKAVVFARRDVEIGSLPGNSGGWIADLPHPGERISRGRPICTVFAEAPAVTLCRRLLATRAAAVYRAVEAPVGSAA